MKLFIPILLLSTAGLLVFAPPVPPRLWTPAKSRPTNAISLNRLTHREFVAYVEATTNPADGPWTIELQFGFTDGMTNPMRFFRTRLEPVDYYMIRTVIVSNPPPPLPR